MLANQSTPRNCFSSYPRSFSSSRHPHPSIDIKSFQLRKSIFNPALSLAESYRFRHSIFGVEVPLIEIVHSSNRWLLVQSPRYGNRFFRYLNSDYRGNPYDELLRLFRSFVSLSFVYGFFRVRGEMVFTERRKVRVWMSEDVFAVVPRMPLQKSIMGERAFVSSFLEMLQEEVKGWERTSNVFTIEDVERLLEWRSQLNRGSMTAVEASRQVLCRESDCMTSFEANELRAYKKKLGSCSVQSREGSVRLDAIKVDMSNSLTIKQPQSQRKNGVMYPRMFGVMCESKETKKSRGRIKTGEGEVRRTKKKFNLTSTSSTLQHFSERWRTTIGKKSLRQQERHGSNEPRVHLSPLIPQPSIENELQDLFGEEERELKLGVEGDREQLQKIAQEMQQVLIW